MDAVTAAAGPGRGHPVLLAALVQRGHDGQPPARAGAGTVGTIPLVPFRCGHGSSTGHRGHRLTTASLARWWAGLARSPLPGLGCIAALAALAGRALPNLPGMRADYRG